MPDDCPHQPNITEAEEVQTKEARARVNRVFLLNNNGELGELIRGENLIKRDSGEIFVYQGTNGKEIILLSEISKEKFLIPPEEIINYRRALLSIEEPEPRRKRPIIWYDVNGGDKRCHAGTFDGEVWG